MDDFRPRREAAGKIVSSALLFAAAAGVAWTLSGAPVHNVDGPLWVEIAATAGVLAFVSASIRIFSKSRAAYCLGLIAGILTAPWFVWTEQAMRPWLNSWIVFNFPEPDLVWASVTTRSRRLTYYPEITSAGAPVPASNETCAALVRTERRHRRLDA